MKKRTWTEQQLKEAVAKAFSLRKVLAILGLKEAGGNYTQLRKYINEYSLDTTHFKGQGWNKGLVGIGKPRFSLEDILVENGHFQSYKLKNRLFKAGLKFKQCEECGWAQTTPDGHLPLELDHINGKHSDNRLENLRILCPNCHSLKPSHRGRNKGK